MPASVTGRLTLYARRHEAGAVPEHRHVLDVVPRAHVRQPGADEVGLERDVGELRAAIGPPAPPRPQEELVRDGAGEGHQVVVARLRARGQARHGDGGGHEQAEGEREQEEALRGHWATSVPDLAPNDNRGGSLDDVASGRRLTMLVVALALVGAPAVALTAFCVGESCAQEEGVTAAVPFCPLPADLRHQIEAGYRQGRSPDVMATTTSGVRLSDDAGVVWPRSPYEHAANDVPIVFFGHGVNPGQLPDGIGVDRIAPTIARVMGYDRPHPEIRSGVPLDGCGASRCSPAARRRARLAGRRELRRSTPQGFPGWAATTSTVPGRSPGRRARCRSTRPRSSRRSGPAGCRHSTASPGP